MLIGVSACQDPEDFLDSKTDAALNKTKVFSDSLLTIRFLVSVYQDAPFNFFKGRWDSHGNTEQATDDAEYNYSGIGQKAVILYNGTLSPVNFPFPEFWNLPYTNIRRVNLFLSKLPGAPLSNGLKTRMAAEARFLRAWYYHSLLVTFGGVPIVGDEIYGLDDRIDAPRNSFAECVDYVVKELDEVAAILPVEHAEQDYGRATRGACMALKSRVLLYAASPLFNGGSEATTPEMARIVSYPDSSVTYWQAAADAADAVIKSGYYSLHTSSVAPGHGFFQVFLRRFNKEYIFAFHRGQNRDMEGFYNPPTRGGQRNSMPTHNLVDAFPMRNGKAITDPASGYNPLNPYVNRDPRFDYTIIYNTSLYYLASDNAKRQVMTYDGSPTADGFSETSSSTGYYSRKMCDDNISSNSSFQTERGWPLIRYAEVLLNYAEAINEIEPTLAPQAAYDKLIELRIRAGIQPGADNLYGLKANMTKLEMRAVIRNERRIELAFEDHRWNDIRRWKIAMKVNNGFNKRMRIINNSGNYTYQVINTIRLHNFRPEMYLLPIPDSEIRKMPKMVQNPKW
jgi:hypothetical protein